MGREGRREGGREGGREEKGTGEGRILTQWERRLGNQAQAFRQEVVEEEALVKGREEGNAWARKREERRKKVMERMQRK
jgi:hypothetical protein